MSLTQVLSLNSPQLSTINAGTGNRENGVTMLEAVIVQILDWYDIEWQSHTIRECAELMHSEYYWFTIAELKYFVQSVKLGRFGDVYGKFLPKQLMLWAAKHAGDCLDAREVQSYHTKRQELPEPENVAYVDPEKVAEALKDFREMLTATIGQDEPDEAEKEANRQKQREAYAKLEGLQIDWDTFFEQQKKKTA